MALTTRECRRRLKGLIPVQTCPYTDTGALDIGGLRANTEFICGFAKNKDVALLANGDTTEFYANTIEDQRKLIEATVETVAGQMPVIVGVSQPSLGRAVAMARLAEKLGADCVMALPPHLHRATKEGGYQFYQGLAASVSVGVMLYNFPNISGTLLPVDLLGRLSKIDNVVAVKNCSSNSMDNVYACLSVDPEDMVLIDGWGELTYVGNAAYGGSYRGFVSVVGNFAPARCYQLYEAVQARDFPRASKLLGEVFFPVADFMDRVQSSRGDTISALPWWMGSSTTYIAVAKHAMDLVGLCGGKYQPGELPMEDLTPAEKKDLKVLLMDIGIL
jgi:dihydrodipicolinate synthase/N-acetylneuraminate lyase